MLLGSRAVGGFVVAATCAATLALSVGPSRLTNAASPATEAPTLAPPPGEVIAPLEGGIVAVAFSREGRVAALGSAQGTAVIELPSRRRVAFIPAARARGHALALSADGRLLGAVRPSGEVAVWDVRSGAVIAGLPLVPGPEAIAFSPQGDLLAVGGAAMTLQLWDLAKRGVLWRKAAASAAGRVCSLAFSPDGRLLLSGNTVELSGGAGDEVDMWPESPRLWDVASAAQIAAFDEGQSLTTASADWRRVAGTAGSTVHVWERASGREIANLKHFPLTAQGRWVIGAGLGPDGTRALSLGSDGTLVAWDVAGERVLWRVAAHTTNAQAFALSPDGRYALTVGGDGLARFWDVGAHTAATERP